MIGKTTHINKVGNIQAGLHLVRNWKSMRCMIKDTWKGHYKMSGFTKLLIAVGIAYIVMPFDFDWIPVIGWLDDGLVFFLLVKRLQTETQRYVRAKVMERKGEC